MIDNILYSDPLGCLRGEGLVSLTTVNDTVYKQQGTDQ